MKIVNKIALSLFCLTVALVLPMLQVHAVEDIDQEADSFYITLESVDTGISSSSGKAYTCYRSAKSGALDASYAYYYVQSDIYDINQTYYFYLYKVDSNGVITDASYISFLYDKSRYVYEDGGEGEQERTFSSMHLQFSPSASFSLNVPVFLSREALENYIESGDDSGCIYKPIFGPERFYDPDCFLVNPTMSYTKGTSALSGTLSTFMGIKLNNGLYSYSSRNMKYMFLWDSVNTSFEMDLSSSYMRIDIICNDQVYTFSDSEFLLSSDCIEITLQDILSFLNDNGVDPVIESFFIRYTPFYNVGLKTYYGRSVRFFVKANSAGVLSESQGDDLYGSNIDYSDTDIVSPDDLPVKIPGFTDDESFEFDFSYDSENMFKNFFGSLKSLISYCGQIPALINKVFSFLPGVYGDMIVIILAACFVMRLLGR